MPVIGFKKSTTTGVEITGVGIAVCTKIGKYLKLAVGMFTKYRLAYLMVGIAKPSTLVQNQF